VRAADPADTHPGLNLIPWPKLIAVQPGFMKLTTASRIVPADPGLKPLADILADEINLLTSIRPAVADGPDRAGDIVLKLNQSLKADEQILVARPPELLRTTDGAHTLTVDAQAVVEGFDYRAVAEGTATLLQAIRQAGGQAALPKLAIKDWPHADYCGMMVDCGRQEQPLEWLKKMIVTCRMYKVRYLHLHLTDDQGWCFPSTKYPQLGSKNVGTHGGLAPKVYPLEDLKGLVAFADARGIAIVPELEMPGHSGAALRSLPEVFDALNPETRQPVDMGCMNMASEEIYPALDTLIGEMCDVFKSSPYFHIGSDEVTMGRVSLAPSYKSFMAKHNLKNDGELANFFIARVNDSVKKRGKKTIKWEGIANTAAKDIIIMTWDGRSNMASKLIADGYATITCPWALEVPWEQWSMYECNCSKLKKGDPVLGATLVAWEQSAEVHTGMLRNVAARQERTWGPDNSVTEAGFAARFQPQDAAVGKLIGLPPPLGMEGTFTAPAGTCDLLQPGFACDGNDKTFYRSAAAPKADDHFTIELKPVLVYAIEVLTGINGKGLMDGAELQVSTDGSRYVTLAKLANGTTRAVLSDHKIKAVRLWCATPQSEAMVVREIKIQLMVEVSGIVAGPAKVLGADNIGVLTGDTTFQWANAACLNPVINKGFTLTFDSGGGNASGYKGPISGTGMVVIHQGVADGGFRDSPMVLGGKEPNLLTGTWQVKCGRLTLAKDAGVDAAGGTIVVGGQGDNDCLYWANNDQLNDAAVVELLDSPKGGATLKLNGFSDRIASLKLAPHTKIVTDDQQAGGVLTVAALVVDGKAMPKGVYTSANAWLTGSGFVVVGDIQSVKAAGMIDNANATIGSNNIAILTAATTFGPATGNCGIPVRLGGFDLTLVAPVDKPATYSGFITGSGGVTFAASADDPAPSMHALELVGPTASSYKGPTVLTRGILKLNKPAWVIAIPGDLLVGGATAANADDTVILAGDGQLAPTATVTLNGKAQPCFLDLAGHQTTLAKVLVEGRAKIRTGSGGRLKVKQLVVDGKPITAGTHRSPQAWLEGSGTVTIDPRVEVKGRYGNPGTEIGPGNIGIMSGDTEFWVGVGTCDIDLVTNSHTITFDSGDGNALCYLGSISGTGNVVLLMGPSRTGFKDAPLRLAGPKPNTTTGKFIARKGRVQLEKPDGVDAISGDVFVGGQGFNDCLHWINGNQIKDTVTISLLEAGNNGAAYLSLNGCTETVAALTMAANTTVRTDSPEGKSGVLTVKALTVNNLKQPAGTYTAATAKWLDGKGSVVVAP
jgi:Glycosyl hydrolase family 20, catalytic domain/Glycosyl hydrolase family 20, domain 2